jgi:hypothetical protein
VQQALGGLLNSPMVSTIGKSQFNVRVINYANLIHFKPDSKQKRLYYFAEYLSPE